MTDIAPLDRRAFVRGAISLGAGAALSGPFAALAARAAGASPVARKRRDGGYGPIGPVKDETTGLELLWLPSGFEYISYGWTGDLMDDGVVTPGAHDGMAAYRSGGGRGHDDEDIFDVSGAQDDDDDDDDHHGRRKRRVRLVRNHERGQGQGAYTVGPFTYDPNSGGGTTNLEFDGRAGAWLSSYSSLSGTVRNCAGGPTPWGTWLTCEETFLVDSERHGYVFEVPADGTSDAQPLVGLGRFVHEAAAVDPKTGYVYLTEDTGDSAFYRFRPNRRGKLADGGTLEALVLDGGGVNTEPADTGATWSASWVTIDQPDPDDNTVRIEAQSKGAAIISRGEGCWYGNKRIYFISTSGGPVGEGQVFEYDPRRETVTVVFASPDAAVLDNPDNIAVSPRGGLILCEDGDAEFQAMHALSPDGEIVRFAANHVVLNGERNGIVGNFTGSEWAGATFEPRRGEWLFANIQSPGITFAITGPWHRGVL